VKHFVRLLQTLNRPIARQTRVGPRALFCHYSARDAVWALFFLSSEGCPVLRPGSTPDVVGAESGLPDWLVGDCYCTVGDSAETVALLLPPASRPANFRCMNWSSNGCYPWFDCPNQPAVIGRSDLAELSTSHRFVYNKLITGTFRAV